jgi:polysaccharide pyruvyl transferase WcaK-like protein
LIFKNLKDVLPPWFIPHFIGWHINQDEKEYAADLNLLSTNTSTVDGSSITATARKPRLFLQTAANVKYLNKHGPIGCRDQATCDLLTRTGIPASYVSCCATLTLGNHPRFRATCSETKRTETIYVVDSNILERELYTKLIPEKIRKTAEMIYHGLDSNCKMSYDDRMATANEMLMKYRTAKCVITSRLHCALPCIAFGTPVVFLFSKMVSVIVFLETANHVFSSRTLTVASILI